MVRYKALLIGVAQYEAPGISSLPFIPEDLELMGAALAKRGFHQVHLVRAPWFTPNVINGEVAGFLAGAKRGDRLLVMLSGHGVHSEGKDYLVPQDIRPELSTFTSGCVEIDWRDELENSSADQVVFLIDACREGIQRDTMGDTMGTAAWSDRRVAATLRRKVAYVYACSQAEVARFVRDTESVRDGCEVGTGPRESFSLFSRAVSELLGGPVSSLRELRSAAQSRINALHTAYGKPGRPQRVRILTEDDQDDFVIFPPLEGTAPATGAELTWAEAVVQHVAWKLTDPAQATAVTLLKDVAERLAAHFAALRTAAERSLAEDPWYDRELAQRTTERMGFLLLRLTAGTRLSPTEAALLSLLPYAAQAHWASHAARRGLADDELSQFLQEFSRLDRRLRTLDQGSSQAARDIRWWGLHRWLVQQPEAFTPTFLTCSDVASLPYWTSAELSASRLLSHLREQRVAPGAAPGTARNTALVDERPVAAGTPYEHTVRERLVSALFKAAHALAIDPADLPEVLVEHLGISDGVSLKALRTTVRRSHWLASGAGRSLSALCEHPAVELALRHHSETVDALLRDIHKQSWRDGGSLAPLASLPAYADAQLVRLSAATPAELSAGIRFRLADDRVQELLMGEQLYGERGLAIRELYQNALDALRYRSARTEYLRRTGTDVDWQGRVLFTEGTDDADRPYLECSDNGIGMGYTELSRSFSRGGSRFVDLPEYTEEAALWASLDPPIELHPVSRFGLGVLSYFMIADEITVTTCRLDRAGRPGRVLKVTIAGPGNLFRVEDLGPGTDAGTTVRLYGSAGRELPSSGEELHKYLWVSPYRVEAHDGRQIRQWAPGVLADDKVRDLRPWQWSSDPPQRGSRRTFDLTSDPTPYVWSRQSSSWTVGSTRGLFTRTARTETVEAAGQGMWWARGEVPVLVDGISADKNLFGRVVNLHAEQATLSVDRKSLLHYDEKLVHDRCVAAVDDLVDHPAFLTPSWLQRVHDEDSVLADEITDRASRKGIFWKCQDWTLDPRRTGYFPADLLLLPAVTGTCPWAGSHHDIVAALMILCMPEPVVRWRLRALHPEQATDPLPIARPSDMELLSLGGLQDRDSWDDYLSSVSARFARRRRHGVGAQGLSYPEDSEPVGLVEFDTLPFWRPDHRPVSAQEALVTAARMRCGVGEVAERLNRLGYDVVPLGGLAAATAEDLPLLSLDRRKILPEALLPPGACVPLAHLYVQEDPAAAAARLHELGYVLPDRVPGCLLDPGDIDSTDRNLAWALLNQSAALPTSRARASKATPDEIRRAAGHENLRPKAATERLVRLGFSVSSAVRDVFATGRSAWRPALRDFNGPTPTLQTYERSPEGPSPRDAVRALALFDAPRDGAGGPGGSLRGLAARTVPGNQDRSGLPSVIATRLRVAATLADVSVASLKAVLKGLDQVAKCDDDPAYDLVLMRSFAPAGPGGDSVHGKGRTVKLAEIAAAAIMVQRPFRQVAARATELGFRHDAETWFTRR